MMTTAMLQCERCPTVRQGKPGMSIEDLRAGLQKVGWLCVAEIDVCPPCRTKGVEDV
jgi:hypothetical protein